MRDFSSWMGEHQATWRKANVRTTERGTHGRHERSWILPPADWEEGLWPALRNSSPNSVARYLAAAKAEKHTGCNNLKSSWIACANLYFPFRATAEGRDLLAGFLRRAAFNEIRTVDAIELEYAEEGELHPATLLGESGGSRGKGQTSPDIAFVVNGGAGIVLTESKLTEHSFYACSARAREDRPNCPRDPGRPPNPDRSRCLDAAGLATDAQSLCHQIAWGRRYWEQLRDAIDHGAVARLKACPAAFAGYQLFRQQALAEGYAGKYDLVISAVAYDARNDALIQSLCSTGIDSFPKGWAALFKGRSRFAAWTHQAWVDWVRQHQSGEWGEWLEWIEARYGYGPTDLEVQGERSGSDTK